VGRPRRNRSNLGDDPRAPGRARGDVVRIDPETNKVVATIDLAQYVNSLAVGAGGIWVAVSANDFPDV
jgi:hypothetical protein